MYLDASHRAGFTLYETAVVLAIIGLLTVALLVGYPAAREHQALLLAEQQIQSQLKEAAELALNETRSEACLSLYAEDDRASQRRCSDIGVAIRGGELEIFADTDDDNVRGSTDFFLHEQPLTLSSGVTVADGSHESFLFEATPPSLTLYVDGESRFPGRLKLKAGRATRELTVGPYGQVGVIRNL